ncbi:MAG: flagellar protein FlgN [Sporomusaceae bacterium]|nr:flagellar protein FlgN [Sporomusaceae bacterium]
MWDKLTASLHDLTALYRVMLEVSRKKKQALIAAEVAELEQLVKQEEALILQIGACEKARTKLIGELANACGLPADELTLTKAKALSGSAAVKLEAAETELTAVIAELAPLNKTNAELIRQSLNYVNFNLNILTQTVADPNYAAKGGDQSAPRSKSLIDAKI